MTDFFSIFQPGMQHVREHREFEKVRVVEAPDGAPHDGSVIDFDAGTAHIVPPPPGSPAAERDGQ